MPSSFSSLLKSQNSSSSGSSSSLENVSRSDQSEEDDDNRINIGYCKTRTTQNDNDMLERPSDYDDSCSQSDDTDNEDENEKGNNPRSVFLTRQLTLYENDWPTKKSTLIETEDDSRLFFDTNQEQLFSSERSKLVGSADKKHQPHNTHTSLSSNLKTSTHELQSTLEPSALSQTKTSATLPPTYPSTMHTDQRRSLSKIPIRAHSSSQSRSRSPSIKKPTKIIPSPACSSKIPLPVSTTSSNGAFHFFTADDHQASSKLPPTSNPTRVSNQSPKQASPFTPITHSKKSLTPQKISSAGNTPSKSTRRPQLAISDDEDDSEASKLEEADLKLKLKEQKRHGKKTGELLNKLHENYEQLLEKYAQAENTIDQLRFQPKLLGDNTPPMNASEATVHFIEQPKVSMATMQSGGIYHPTNITPISLVRRISTTSTTTTTALKSASPTNSATAESIYFDESAQQKFVVQELTIPETIKLDLLIQTKTLSEKMKSFLTLMDANQLSLAEQKQVYENIKEDYEKLLRVVDQTKQNSDFSDIDFDADINKELETMRQLLKEIVKRITDNLLGKSSNGSDHGGFTREENQSSRLSDRSSLCNHTDLMDQYKKIINAVDTEMGNNKNDNSRDSSQSSISNHQPTNAKHQKPYVYISGNSDDEQQQLSDTLSTQIRRGTESTLFNAEYFQSISPKFYQQINEEQAHIHGITKSTKKRKSPKRKDFQEYDNLENITKSKRKTKTEQKKISNNYQNEKDLSPSSVSMATGTTRHSASSMRTRISDYDSGIGTHNTTKLSRDSKLNTSAADESHYQSLDEERRQYSDEEQESISNISSSRSSGSGAASPGSPYTKYTKRIDRSLSLKQLNENRRRKLSGHSDVYPSDIERHITGSFDQLSQASSYKRKSHHTWQPKQTTSNRSYSRQLHRSLSTESIEIENYKNSLHRPRTAPLVSSTADQSDIMSKKYQSGFIRQSSVLSKNSGTIYKSSIHINEPHTHRKSQENLHNKNSKQYYKQPQAPVNLYLDPQTGVIYRYVQNKTQPPPPVSHYPAASKTDSSKSLHRCGECGNITTYQHRHHIESISRRMKNDIEDPGYESGTKRINQYRLYKNLLSSTDSDSDNTPNYSEMTALDQAYERARKMQQTSRNLSRHISRQLKLVVATI